MQDKEVKHPSTSGVTELLVAVNAGSPAALDEVFTRVYDELHRLAHHVRRDRAGATLDTTALVHEAYLKLATAMPAMNDRRHFLAVAARAMRQVLVSAARDASAQKRGGDVELVTLSDADAAFARTVRPEELLALDDALERLAKLDARQAAIVECRFFAGLDVEETAEILGISAPTVGRDWRAARAWLGRELRGGM